MDVINPATGVKFGRLAESSKADVDRFVIFKHQTNTQ